MKRMLLIAAVSIPATAYMFGGWAVTTVENVPESAVAGKPFDLTWSVRQHGQTLLARLSGTVTVSSGDVTRSFNAMELGTGRR